MRCVVWGMRNAVRCEIWCYGAMVIWPALQARAFALGTGYAVCCTQCEVWVMCLEIWIMRIAVSNVVSEYSVGGVGFTHRVRDRMFGT